MKAKVDHITRTAALKCKHCWLPGKPERCCHCGISLPDWSELQLEQTQEMEPVNAGNPKPGTPDHWADWMKNHGLVPHLTGMACCGANGPLHYVSCPAEGSEALNKRRRELMAAQVYNREFQQPVTLERRDTPVSDPG